MAGSTLQGDGAEQLLGIAIQVALRTGLLLKCPLHDDVYDPGQHDYQGAVMVAAFLFNQSDPLVAPFRNDRGRLAELLRSICNGRAAACPECFPPASGDAA